MILTSILVSLVLHLIQSITNLVDGFRYYNYLQAHDIAIVDVGMVWHIIIDFICELINDYQWSVRYDFGKNLEHESQMFYVPYPPYPKFTNHG